MATEKIVLETEVELGNSTNSVKSLKAELRQVTNELANLEEGSAAFVRAAQKAGELQDKIGDVKNTINAFNPEAKFQALAGAVGIAANGFSAMQGVMALFGSESEDLNKIIAQTQGAIALATGLNGLLGMKDAFNLLKLQAVTTFATIKATAVTTFTTIKGAMLATGIGALIVALGLVINEIIEYNKGIDEEASKQKKLNDELEKSRELMEKVAAESEKTRNAKKGGLDDLKREKDLLVAKGATEKEIFEKTQQIAQQELQNLKTRKYSGLEVSKEIADKENEIKVNELAFDKKIKDNKKEDQKKREEEAKKKKEFEKKLIEEQKKQQADLIARTEKEYQDTNKLTDDFYKTKQLELIKSGASEEEIKKGQQQIEIKDLEQKIQNAKDYGQSTVDLELELEQKKIDVKKDAAKKQEDILQEAAKNEKLSAEERYAALDALNKAGVISDKEASDAKIAIAKAEKDAKFAELDAYAGVLNQASDLLGKNTVEGKAMAIAAATISTYTAIAKTLAAHGANPIPGYAIAQAIVTGIAGFAAVKNIIDTPIPNQGGGGGGGTPSMPSMPAAPAMRPTGFSTGQPSQTPPKVEPQKVYVVESDITNSQNKVARIQSKATIQ
jgi:hypothetical protein